MRDPHLFGFLDPGTVELLETLTPEASHDAASIASMMDKREIFPSVDDPFTREEMKSRILRLKGRILSFYTFFDDWKYMEVLVKSVRPLLGSGFNGSLRDEFLLHFKANQTSRGIIKIQTAEHRYRICHGTLNQQQLLAYFMIFLAAMRDFPILSQIAPRKSKGEKKPLIQGLPEERQSYLAQLAVEIGFESPEIDKLVAADPDLAAARSFLRRSRPQDQYEINERDAFSLSKHIAEELKRLATPLSRSFSPEFSCQLDKIEKQFRCGLPDNQSHMHDRQHLYLDVIYNYNPIPRYHLTSLAFQRDIFVSYFGIVTLPQPLRVSDSPSDRSEGQGGPSYSETAFPDSNEIQSSLGESDPRQDNGQHAVPATFTEQEDMNVTPDGAQIITSPTGTSFYEASHSESSSRPMSNFPEYLRSIEAAIWPHTQPSESPQLEAEEATAQSHLEPDPLATGFEKSLARTMNVFHSLDSCIRPSDAATKFLSVADLIVVFLWNEVTYIKFQPLPGQRWVFEETMNLLADRDYCFVWIDEEKVVVNDVCDIWAIARDARLVFVGPKAAYSDEESKESFLNWIDAQI